MLGRRHRLVTACGVFLIYITLCYLATVHHLTPASPDTMPGGRHLTQLTTPRSDSGSGSGSGFGSGSGRPNCSRPAIERFPPPGMDQAERSQGGVVLYILVALYCFLGLAVVCDDYFVPSLEVIANALHLSEDVAGATFLAAGSSAPEFATTTLGVFVTKDDIGISGVIGSAVFNAMLVISLVSLLIGDTVRIKCYPMLRDITCYLAAIVALLLVIYDNMITWWESTILVLMYLLYCLVMWKNRSIERWMLGRFVSAQSSEKQSLMPQRQLADDAGDGDTSEEVQREMTGEVREVPYSDHSPFEVPIGKFSRCVFVAAMPIVVGCYVTMPDVRKERWRAWYPLTFVIAMVWISFYSYMMIWMITVVGFTLHIPDTIMGLSFVAIGVSIPDVLASVAVARDGYADMAVSNALGSNVFDILFCMGVPWLLATGIVQPGSIVRVDSGGMLYSTLLLLSTVVFLLVATYISRWRLSRLYGISLMIWYATFLIVACLYEMNVFGQLTLPTCPSWL